MIDLTHAKWRTSSYTNGSGACVEVAWPGDHTAVRDTKKRDGGTLLFPAGSFAALVDMAKDGKLEI